MTTIQVTIPFESGLSKNRIRGTAGYVDNVGPDGIIRRYPKRDHEGAKSRVADAIVQASASVGATWHSARIHVNIFVVLPKFIYDATNVISTIADAVQIATGVNDKWLTVCLDWKVDKTNPRIEIELSQEAIEDFAYCSVCNREMAISAWHAYSLRNLTSGKTSGIGPCRECTNAYSRANYTPR